MLQNTSGFNGLFYFLKNNSLSRANLTTDGDVINIHYGDVLIKYGDVAYMDMLQSLYIANAELAKSLFISCPLKDGDIIIADAAEDNTVGKCTEIRGLRNRKAVSGLHTIPCRPIYEMASGYMGCYINSNSYHNQLLPLIQGTKISSISKRTLSQTALSMPSTSKEQQSIAQYFRNLDSLIQTTEKKITSLKQVKEASLQAMFPAEGETVPKVRFKGFDGEWKKEKLSKYAKRITRKNTNLETTLPVTISSVNGIISQTSFFNNVVAGSNLKGYYLIKKGEFAYNKSYSNGYPWGSVKRLEKYEMGALSTLYIVFELNAFISQEYALSFFETNLWHREVSIRAAEGARNHGLLNISADDFFDINILVPTEIAEQDKIASYFTSLDKQITIQTQRLEKLKQIKSACLDAMFV